MIPLVDLAVDTAHRQLEAGLREFGFVRLTNHGVAAAVSPFRHAADDFFALDIETKKRFVHPDALANRGFRAKGSEALSYSLGKPTPPDLFESFNCGAPEVRADLHEMVRATPWPNGAVPHFEGAAASMFEELRGLSQRIEGLLERILGIELDTPGPRPDMMACIDYQLAPDGTETTVDGQQRMGAHSDYTAFTLLYADPVPGLQIVSPSGGWVDIVPESGEVLLNVGDVLAMWTNDAWPSTLHRVVPFEAGAAATRRSVAYFRYPPLSTTVRPLDAYITNERPARYEPVTVEDHLRGKLATPKIRSLPTSASTEAGRI